MKLFQVFWNWYNKHLFFNTALAAFLFSLQLVHLYWLTTHVVFLRVFGESFFNLTGIWQLLILVVDYTEIPAILTTSLVYINDLRRRKNTKALLYLLFLNSQWLHIFWITDEFILEAFGGQALLGVPSGLAWIAIGIDYLELPVIFDTLKRLPKFFIGHSGLDPESRS